jgi:hypothetical protein
MVARGWAGRALAVSVVAIALVVPAGSAHADITAYDDPVGDSTGVDISRVRIVHRNAVTVRVTSAVPLDVDQTYTFWVDTGRGPGRPTYRVSFVANAGFDDALGVVGSFGERPSRFVRCRGMRARADMFADDPVSLRIPRRCLGDPKRVRVAVRFADGTTGGVDWAPARRTFGPWVAHSDMREQSSSGD